MDKIRIGEIIEGDEEYFFIEVEPDGWIEVASLPDDKNDILDFIKEFNEQQGKNGKYIIITTTKWLLRRGLEIIALQKMR